MNLNLSIKTIRSITNADFIESSQGFQTTKIQNIVIDSRSPSISQHTLFVILKGNKTSGAAYINDFIQKKGQVALAESRLDNPEINQIIVKNAVLALQEIAAHHRSKFDIPVIGITGSNGKTTVKEWLYHLLKDTFKIVRSPKSYNSQIGVALSVLEMDETDELGIFEAGISKSGEMEALEKMIQPTTGIFTGIGDAHNSGFVGDNPEALKQKEKYLLFEHVNHLIEKRGDSIQIRKESILQKVEIIPNDTEFSLIWDNNNEILKTPFQGKGAISNAALVSLAALAFGLDITSIREGLLNLPVISMRLERINGKANNLLINDAYNLDEKSLEIAGQFLNMNAEGKKRTIFLAENSDHINTETTLLHALQKFIAQIKIDTVVYFGPKAIASQFDFIAEQYETVPDFFERPLQIENQAVLFTGARSCHLETVVNHYTEKKHITRLLVNLAAMRNNLNLFREKLDTSTKILAMVKAQSYGGGILEVAKFLEKENVNYFGVAYADEGVTLRKGGISLPILVMNPEPAAFEDMIDFDLEPSIYSLDLLNAFIHQLILKRRANFPVHIKLDTGMNRLGFRKAELNELLAMLNTQPEVYVRSVFSHLAVADITNEEEYTQNQIAEFRNIAELMQAELGYSFTQHLANSAGAFNYPATHFDMVRLGIGLFGLLKDDKQLGFENVLVLNSQVSQIRKIKAGESVGYGRSFIADKDTTIGIIPVGYSDGLRRGLGNGNWAVQIGDKKYNIISNVCMDTCMIDIGNDPIHVGDEVELFGEENSVFEMSRLLETIPYEIISGISSRVQRIYLEE
ncbi:MAG: bifunctional UDP-N-acetylmuramoyl-tripeptide:D-alanyl-D-alanine ligase/alanine racemase [Crocinitomix sp.]|nr:bifunctional UDP-N-acetylmuramoyl-tripeptide:D-alanyl-D-alanine ligase/alanine racemase [Crocinitomix sp.]